MRRTLCALVASAVVGIVSLTVDASCSSVPNQLCRGSSVNRRLVPNTTEPDDHCAECIEGSCCDLVGDCQSTTCANEVGDTHGCVLDAGRRGAVTEPACVSTFLKTDESKKVYQCMREHCGPDCALPTCRLDPVVPPIGTIACDRCFAQACCELMNECAKNRTCLITLKCIVDECGGDFSTELRTSEHAAAVARRDQLCGPDAPPVFPPEVLAQNCFARCIQRTFVEGSEEAVAARCLAAQINECGADVDCGEPCSLAADAGGD